MSGEGDGPLFDCRNVAHAIIANRLMMIRRRQPAMGGPNPSDIRAATDLIRELESHGLRIVADGQ